MLYNKKILNFSLFLLVFCGISAIIPVSNNLRSNSSQNTTESISPTNITASNSVQINAYASNINSISFTFNWEITNYALNTINSIQIQENATNNIIYSDFDIVPEDLNSSIIVEGLKSETTYNYNIIVDWTWENSKQTFSSDTITLSTLKAEGIDDNLTTYFSEVSKTSVTINWEIKSSSNYTINRILIKNSNSDIIYEETPSSLESSYTINGLIENTEYNYIFTIEYTDLESNSMEHFDRNLEIKTLDSNEKANIYAYSSNIGENFVTINWEITQSDPSSKRDIKIINSQTLSEKPISIESPELIGSYTIDNLKSNTDYTFQVILIATINDTIYNDSYDVNIKTLQVNNEMNVYASDVGLTSTTINWEITKLEENDLNTISVVDNSNLLPEVVEKKIDPLATSSITINNLIPNKEYDFVVVLLAPKTFPSDKLNIEDSQKISVSTLSIYGKNPEADSTSSNVTINSVEINWNIQYLSLKNLQKIEIINKDNNDILYTEDSSTIQALNDSVVINDLDSNEDYTLVFKVTFMDLENQIQSFQEEITFTTLSNSGHVYIIIIFSLLVILLLSISAVTLFRYKKNN